MERIRSKEQVIKLIKKLRELMDPDNNATEGEIEASAASIQRLLKSHNLEMSEVESSEIGEKKKRDFEIGQNAECEVRRTSLCGFQKTLMVIVAAACECGVFYGKKSVKRDNGRWGTSFIITFVGEEVDCLVAKELFDYLNQAIFKFGRKHFPGSNPEQTAFHFGCVSRLTERFNETEKDFEEEHGGDTGNYAIVLRDKKVAVRDYMDTQLSLRKGRSGGRGSRGSMGAYDKGREIGGKMDIGRRKHLT